MPYSSQCSYSGIYNENLEACAAYILITLNKRLETAAAAIAQRIINRRSPLVFRPVVPWRNGSTEDTAMMSRW